MEIGYRDERRKTRDVPRDATAKSLRGEPFRPVQGGFGRNRPVAFAGERERVVVDSRKQPHAATFIAAGNGHPLALPETPRPLQRFCVVVTLSAHALSPRPHGRIRAAGKATARADARPRPTVPFRGRKRASLAVARAVTRTSVQIAALLRRSTRRRRPGAGGGR